MLTAAAVPGRLSFSGHESFPLRSAWLPKAVRELSKDPSLFTREDAPVRLGVGKNMVASIRHWCLATGIGKSDDFRLGDVRISRLGRLLFSDDGWDPYLEDLGTLWLLHWHLVRDGDRASTWKLAFGRWATSVFSREQLANWLLEIARTSSTVRATPASIRRDVDVFVRTYTPTRATRDLSLEDSFDCPLVELGLIQEIEPRIYEFTRNSRPSLPDWVFTYALFDYWQSKQGLLGTLSFEAIQNGMFAPGSAFRLTGSALSERLDSLPEWSGLRYDETAGTRVVLRSDLPKTALMTPTDFLEETFVMLRREQVDKKLLRGEFAV